MVLKTVFFFAGCLAVREKPKMNQKSKFRKTKQKKKLNRNSKQNTRSNNENQKNCFRKNPSKKNNENIHDYNQDDDEKKKSLGFFFVVGQFEKQKQKKCGGQ